MPTPTKPKRKSKGKRHPLTAESLEQIAENLMERGHTFITSADLAGMFKNEAVRVRKILR